LWLCTRLSGCMFVCEYVLDRVCAWVVFFPMVCAYVYKRVCQSLCSVWWKLPSLFMTVWIYQALHDAKTTRVAKYCLSRTDTWGIYHNYVATTITRQQCPAGFTFLSADVALLLPTQTQGHNCRTLPIHAKSSFAARVGSYIGRCAEVHAEQSVRDCWETSPLNSS
jgi:hypothetical protein